MNVQYIGPSSDRFPRKVPPPSAPQSGPGEPYQFARRPSPGSILVDRKSASAPPAPVGRVTVTLLSSLCPSPDSRKRVCPGPAMEPELNHGGKLSPLLWAPVHPNWAVQCLHCRSGAPSATSASLLGTEITLAPQRSALPTETPYALLSSKARRGPAPYNQANRPSLQRQDHRTSLGAGAGSDPALPKSGKLGKRRVVKTIPPLSVLLSIAARQTRADPGDTARGTRKKRRPRLIGGGPTTWRGILSRWTTTPTWDVTGLFHGTS